MSKKLYVGNLPYAATDADLQAEFGQFGAVVSAKVIFDRETNRSKGFGFVEMASDEDAVKAIAALNGAQFEGRSLTVNEAKPMAPRTRPTAAPDNRVEYGNRTSDDYGNTAPIDPRGNRDRDSRDRKDRRDRW